MENKKEEKIKKENSITLFDLLNIIYKNAWIIVVATFLVFTIGIIFTIYIVKPKYASTSHVLVTVNTSSNVTSSNVANDTTTAVKMLASVAEIMELDPVLDSVITDLNLNATTTSLRNAISVTYGSDTNASLIITVRVEVNDINLSQLISSSVVENTVEYIGEIQDDGYLKGVELVDLKDASNGVYASPNKKLYILASFAAGLVLGCAIVFIKELFETRIKTEKDIAAITDKNIIGLIPFTKESKEEQSEVPKLYLNYACKTAYSKLQSNINFASLEQDVKAIMITSSTPNENKSTIVSNLAYQYADSDNRVIIIDLDLRKPTIHRVFNLPNNRGISDFISSDLDRGSIIQKTSVGIDVITAGNESQFVDKILSSAKLFELIKILKETYDYILVDSAPLSDTADALKIATLVDATLFVIKMNKSSKKFVAKTITELDNAKANILGIVTTNNKTNSNLYYSYYKREFTDDQNQSEKNDK